MKIAFGYKMGTGKDACVKYLLNNYGGEKIYFAKPIYDILYYAQKLCGLNIEKDRKFLQFIGTNWGREKDPDMWVNLVLKDLPNSENIYCSDVRFLNEFRNLKNKGWIMIKVNRNTEFIHSNRIGTGKETHISEHELDTLPDSEWDFILDNNSTLENLYIKLDGIVRDINFQKQLNIV